MVVEGFFFGGGALDPCFFLADVKHNSHDTQLIYHDWMCSGFQ